MRIIALSINLFMIFLLLSACSSKGTTQLSTQESSSTLTTNPTSSQNQPSGSEPTTPFSSTPTASPKPTVRPQPTSSPSSSLDYRWEMREFVKQISLYARGQKKGFMLIPQNGEDIVKDGSLIHQDYLAAIDGIGREDFLYGAEGDNRATASSERKYIKSFLDIFLDAGKQILITDYCSTQRYVLDSYSTNAGYGYVSFAADERDLNSIPAFPATIYNQNTNNISSISEVQNFLYIINPERYSSKAAMIQAISATNYDLVILDLFFDDKPLTASDLNALKVKNNGASRLAICYLSIGEAEDYRYYWQSAWVNNPPAWLERENPEWPGNYKVYYWHPDWQTIIYGNPQSYIAQIISAGFDGVYMDIIDGYEYFEEG